MKAKPPSPIENKTCLLWCQFNGQIWSKGGDNFTKHNQKERCDAEDTRA